VAEAAVVPSPDPIRLATQKPMAAGGGVERTPETALSISRYLRQLPRRRDLSRNRLGSTEFADPLDVQCVQMREDRQRGLRRALDARHQQHIGFWDRQPESDRTGTTAAPPPIHAPAARFPARTG